VVCGATEGVVVVRCGVVLTLQVRSDGSSPAQRGERGLSVVKMKKAHGLTMSRRCLRDVKGGVDMKVRINCCEEE
jgi:uncharacterized protein YacL